MHTLLIVKQTLQCRRWIWSPWLLFAASAGAQEIIELPTEDRWLTPDFEEVYRIGSLSGEAWEQFGNIGEVVFDQAGQLYLLDHHVDSIYVVAPDGEYRRAFGGRGDGPGEFRYAAEFAVMWDGSVVVSDWGYSAYQVFDASGVYERRVGGLLTANITAGDHVSHTGTARSATLAIGSHPVRSGQESGKTGVDWRELSGTDWLPAARD